MNIPLQLLVGLPPLHIPSIISRASTRDLPPPPLFPLIIEDVNAICENSLFSTSLFDKDYIKYALKYRWGPRIKYKISHISVNLYLIEFQQKNT